MRTTREARRIAAARSIRLVSLGSAAIVEGTLGPAVALAQAPEFYPTAPGSRDVAAGDFNRDGFSDLAVGSSTGAITILTNDGLGAFPDARTLNTGGGDYMEVADLDGDRDADIVSALGTAVRVMLNDGAGQFGGSLEYSASANIHGVAMGDVNNDGVPDIVLSQFAGETWKYEVMLNDGRGAFYSVATGDYVTLDPQPAEWSAVTGDFDGDGDVDAAMMQQGYGTGGNYHAVHVHLLINGGDGRQWTRDTQVFNQGDFVDPPQHLVAGDFDGDGDLDLMYNDGGGYGGYNVLLRHLANDGHGEFSTSFLWSPTLDNYTRGVALSDYDGDGGIDSVAVVNIGQAQRQCAVYLLRRPGQYVIFRDTEHGKANALILPELNGDGLRDVVTGVSYPAAGILVSLNAYVPPRPVLMQSPLQRGQATTFTVTGAQPGERVHLLYSLAGTDMSLGLSVLGGVSIDLTRPFFAFASATADGSGEAEVVRVIPPQAPAGAILATQAVIRRGPGGADSVKTNFITAPMEP
ncbi:MAG: VCBS repeat-containing protein [Phycisphaerales bacterium]|nr:VCBS repeat-containing protein [Phycisphaerales bacterium]